ncbi:Hsp20/alpha crystallin family protein [Carnobacterium sp. CS13]|uniref:Hsp20/alpha crystallin family protein n=1 Tax=Carnobacterium sp. CS13 TaxID=2800128 RepID=UPI001914BF8A|nr:Hsp20/alpha crystallin family protein [Carnobacterium sp. CS13]QQP70736.1 Hsp20/alpha crystallin family protein [Carnobacterium sp. CS13]
MPHDLRKKSDFPDFSDFFPTLFDDESPFWDKLSLAHEKNNFKADVHETDKEYEVKVDLPGFDKDNISIEFDHDVLTIHAKRHSEASEKNEEGQYIKQERSYGSMTRQFYLKNADEENSKASYKDGVLTLKMPKIALEDSKNKQISIE